MSMGSIIQLPDNLILMFEQVSLVNMFLCLYFKKCAWQIQCYLLNNLHGNKLFIVSFHNIYNVGLWRLQKRQKANAKNNRVKVKLIILLISKGFWEPSCSSHLEAEQEFCEWEILPGRDNISKLQLLNCYTTGHLVTTAGHSLLRERLAVHHPDRYGQSAGECLPRSPGTRPAPLLRTETKCSRRQQKNDRLVTGSKLPSLDVLFQIELLRTLKFGGY